MHFVHDHMRGLSGRVGPTTEGRFSNTEAAPSAGG